MTIQTLMTNSNLRKTMKNDKNIETLLAQANHYIDPATGAITPPIQSATTYARDEDYQTVGDYSYSRSANPTNTELEKLVAQLEGGIEAKVFASGMAGITAVLEPSRSRSCDVGNRTGRKSSPTTWPMPTP